MSCLLVQGQAPPSNELNGKDPAQNLDSAPPPLSRSQKKALRKAGITEGLSTPGNAIQSFPTTLVCLGKNDTTPNLIVSFIKAFTTWSAFE